MHWNSCPKIGIFTKLQRFSFNTHFIISTTALVFGHWPYVEADWMLPSKITRENKFPENRSTLMAVSLMFFLFSWNARFSYLQSIYWYYWSMSILIADTFLAVKYNSIVWLRPGLSNLPAGCVTCWPCPCPV